MYRNKSFDENLSRELKNIKFAREFLISLMEGKESYSLEEALRIVISKMGIKEYCDLAKVALPNIVNFIKGKRRPKPETLDFLLKPFGLKTKIILEKVS